MAMFVSSWILAVLVTAALAAETEVAISVAPYYTSNAFGLKDEWIDTFAQQQAPGERFADLSTPWDLVTPLQVDVDRRGHRHGSVRFAAGGSVSYEQYLQNTVASFAALGASAALEEGKNGRTRLRVDWTPHRYKRSYENPDVAADEFLQAHYAQWGLTLAHSQRLLERWSMQLSIENERRRYDDVFSNRDYTFWAGALETEHDLGKRVRLDVATQLGTAFSPAGIEEGIVVDRSYDQIELSSRLSSRLGAWRAALTGTLRLRDYTTSNPIDTSHFDRHDRTWKIGTQWDRRLGTQQKLSILLAHANRASDRPADVNDPDIVPYHETTLGVGLAHQF